MKTTILFIFLAIAGLSYSQEVSNFQADMQQAADDVKLLKDLMAYPVIIADSSGHYWYVSGDYALQFDKAYIQMWNNGGDKMDAWLKELQPIEAKVEERAKVSEKITIDKKDFKKLK